MKKILVVYYSQSGQLKRILDSLLSPMIENSEVEVTFEALKPVNDYPFPWSSYEFCDALPESILDIPCDLEPLQCDTNTEYDLIILGYTIWFLAPSIPVNSFLQSKQAKILMKNKPVMTVIGCRNMWVYSQETVKKAIHRNKGILTGNIVLKDRVLNLIGIWSMAYWLLSGKKRRFFNILPKPGISEEDIAGASKFGNLIAPKLNEPCDFRIDQQVLNLDGAVEVDPTLVMMEKRITRLFTIWANFILKKGKAGDKKRRRRVRGFFYYLLFVLIFILPVITIIGGISKLFRRPKNKEELKYYASNELQTKHI